LSWDVLLLRLPDDNASLEDIPGEGPPPLGSRDQVHARVRAGFPDVDLTDPTWGELLGPTWSMELNIGDDDPVVTIMLHIRGGGDDAVAAALRLAEVLDCHAYDLATGDVLEPGGPNGWQTFQAYRDALPAPSDASAADCAS
jgi:hypothetical protein